MAVFKPKPGTFRILIDGKEPEDLPPLKPLGSFSISGKLTMDAENRRRFTIWWLELQANQAAKEFLAFKDSKRR